MGIFSSFGSIGKFFTGGFNKLNSAISWVGNKIVRPGVSGLGRMFGLSPEDAMSRARDFGAKGLEKGINAGTGWLRDTFGQVMGKHGYDSNAQQQAVALRPFTSVDNPAKSYYNQQSHAMKYVRGEIPVPRSVTSEVAGMPSGEQTSPA